jgi:lambda family phage portal protein
MGRKKAKPPAVNAEPTNRKPRRGMRLYQGAKVSRLTADWVTGSTSADAEIATSLVRLRDRARQSMRDDPYFAAAVRSLTTNVVGSGFKLQAKVTMQPPGTRLNKPLNDQIEAKMRHWSRSKTCHTAGLLSFQDIQAMAIATLPHAGELFIRMVPQAFGGGRIPLGLEVIEADQLDERVDGAGGIRGQMTGGTWRLGVHVDDWGSPMEYAFLQKHPGDTRGSIGQKHVLIPADQIIHLARRDRPSQTRGVPLFANSLESMHQLAGYTEAEVVRARAASSLMGFVKTAGEMAGESLGEEIEGEYVTQFEPGVIKTLFPGQDITIPSIDSPGGQFEPFTRVMLRRFAVSIGVSYPAVAGDYSTSNYSSSRLERLDNQEWWRTLQDYLKRELLEPITRAWLRAAVSVGELILPGYDLDPDAYEDAMNWVARGWEWIQPEVEVRAAREAVRSGFKTRAEVIMSRGGDYQETIDALAEEKSDSDRLGLVLDTDPAQVSLAGLTQARPPGSVLPEADPPEPPDPEDVPVSPEDA